MYMQLESEMKRYIGLILVCSFIGYIPKALSTPSGCIIKRGNLTKLDPSCNCLRSNSCYEGTAIKENNKYFEPIKGKSWISYEEKELLRKSHITYNQLLNLKSKGLVNSREARTLYRELDILNKKLQKVQNNTNTRHIEKIELRNKRLGIEKSKPSEDYINKLISFLDTPFEKLTPKTVPKMNISQSLERTNDSPPILPKRKTQVTPSNRENNNFEPALEDNLVSFSERKKILSEIEKRKEKSPQDLSTQEGDSIFTQISKAYIRVAYKILLESDE